MKKFTRILLLSTAIVFPVKIAFSTPKESPEGGRHKRNELERVENILSSVQGRQNTSEPPPGSLGSKDQIDVVSALAGGSEMSGQMLTEDQSPIGLMEAALLSVDTVRFPVQSVPIVVRANPETKAGASPSVSGSSIEVSPDNELFGKPLLPPVAMTSETGILALEVEQSQTAPVIFKLEAQHGGQQRGASTQSSQSEPKKLRVRLTFYSGKDDRWGPRVAWDKIALAKRGRTAAADPSLLPYGTWIHVPGFGKLRIEDTGTAVKTRKASGGQEPVIDIYVEDEKEVMRLAGSTPGYVEITLL